MSFLVLALGAALLAEPASGQIPDGRRAKLVLRLLPAEARSEATILLRDGEREERYREGTGRFLCVSDASTPARLSMVCHHHVLEERLRFERELRRKTGLRGAAYRERLCDEVVSRALEVPYGAMEITATLTTTEDGTYESEMTVYHLIWLPRESTETIGVVDQDPGDGKPWLHQSGTCGAHVMWSEVIRVPSGG